MRVKMKVSALILCLILFSSISVSSEIVPPVSEPSYFNGGRETITNYGAAATIETQDPYLASGTPIHHASAWSMTAGSGTYEFAQVGWQKVYGQGIRYFYEYGNDVDSTVYRFWLGNAIVGNNNNFKVGCDSTTMYFKINDISYGTVSLSDLNWSSIYVFFMGETHNTADQCPGSVSNPVSIGSTQYKPNISTWSSVSCTGRADLTTMGNNIQSSGSTNFEIWDSRW